MEDDAYTQLVAAGSRERKHETGEPRLTALGIMAASVVLMLILCLTAAGMVMFALSRHRAMHRMQELGLVTAPGQKPLTRFPAPNLQLDDGHADSTALIALQETKLNSYGWADRSNGG